MATENGGDEDVGVVEQRKMEFRNRYKDQKDLIKLAKCMKAVQDTRDRLKDELAVANAEFDVLRLEIIPAKMEEKGLENFSVADLGRVGLTADMYVSIKKECKDKFFAWLRKSKMGALIQEGVNSSTLKAFVKNRTLANKPVPKELLNVTPYTRASITKS